MDEPESEASSSEANVANFEVSLPQDRGFVRRQCPTCERQFKRVGERVKGTNNDTHLYCPYCYQASPAENWWTPAQAEYFQAVTYERVVAPSLRELGASLESAGGDLFEFELKGVERPAPMAPVEGANMTRVEFKCHPDEPLRVADDWSLDTACTVCGTRFPVDKVRAPDPIP